MKPFISGHLIADSLQFLKNRTRNYITRRKETENWDDFETVGFWNRWLLWNKASPDGSIAVVKDKWREHERQTKHTDDPQHGCLLVPLRAVATVQR